MDKIIPLLQIVIALGIFNVWCLRLNKPTNYRGGDAKSMEEEFRVYGLSRTIMFIIGASKIILAISLIVGLWHPQVARTAAAGMAVLMLAAVGMHIKVHDPIKKSVPAATMLLMSAAVFLWAAPLPT